MTAMEKLVAHISDAFRPERKEWNHRIIQACRVKAMVEEKRMTLEQALDANEARIDWMLEAFECMALDNTALNIKHESTANTFEQYERDAWDWLKEQAKVAA